MRRRIVAVMLVVFTISILAGCKTKDGNKKTQSEQPVSAKGVYPIVEEPMTIKIFTPQVSSQVSDYDNNKLTKYMQEMTNIGVEWMFAPEKEASQKASLLLSSNKDLPDVFMGQNLKLTQNITTYADQGVFVPLNDYIENDSVYFKKMLEEQPRIKQLLTAPDGNIYSMPLVNLSFPNCVSKKLWINKVWLDNLGLEIPTTTDEFIEVLKAFKTQDPNKNGKNDEIPFIGATTGWNTEIETFLMNSFEQYNSTSIYSVIDGKVTPQYDNEQYREGLRFLHKLVEEGLLDQTSFTQDISQLKQLFENEDCALIGVLPGGGPNTFANMKGSRYHDYVALAPLKGPEGVQLTAYMPDNIMMYETVITSACENPRAVFKYFDVFYSEDVSMRGRWGEPGVDYIVPEKGVMSINGEQATIQGILPWGPPQNSHWAAKSPGYQFFTGNEVRSDDPYELQTFLAEASELYRPYLPDESSIMPNLIYSVDDAKQLAEITTVLSDYIKDSRVKFITGVLDLDKDWDNYLSELEKIGYLKAVEVMQKRLDQFK